MDPVVGDAPDYRSLALLDLVTLVREFGLDRVPDYLEGRLLSTEEFTRDGLVCDLEGEFLDVGEVDERGVVSLESSREVTPEPEPVLGRERVGELDGDIEIRRRTGGTCVSRPEYDCEFDLRMVAQRLFDLGMDHPLVVVVHVCSNA